jgi:MFS family permease
MLSSVLAPALARRNVHYGWAMVAVTFLCMLSAAAAMGMPGVLLGPLHTEFGWDIGEMSGAMGLRLVLYGAVGPFGAALMQRYGLKAAICTALALIVCGLGAASMMTELWELYVCWGLMVGLGTGLTAIVLGATVANRWFNTRRGLVLGLLTSAAATGQLLSLPLAAWLEQRYGWRLALLAPIAFCALAFLAMLLVGRDYPRDLGLVPFGEIPPHRVAIPEQLSISSVGAMPVAGLRRSHAAAGEIPVAVTENAFLLAFGALREASRVPSFWLLFGSFAICGFTTNGLVQVHFIPLCMDMGMTALAGAGVLATMGAFDFIGAVASGWLSDRIRGQTLLFFYYGLRGISLLLLPFTNFSLVALSVFAVFYGLDWIASVPPTVKLVTARFGNARAPLIFAWIFTGHQIGAAIAATGAGVSRDMLASYLPAFFVGGLLCIVAAGASWLVGSRSKEIGGVVSA